MYHEYHHLTCDHVYFAHEHKFVKPDHKLQTTHLYLLHVGLLGILQLRLGIDV